MIKTLLIYFLIFLPLSASALDKGFGLGFESRYELKVNGQEYEGQTWPALSFYLRQKPWALVADIAGMEQDSQVGNLEINQRRIELMPWGRYELDTSGWVVPFAGLGMGLRQTQVNSRLGSIRNRSTSDFEWQTGIVAGAIIQPQSFKLFFSEVSLKYLFNEAEIDPFWSLAFRLGVQTE